MANPVNPRFIQAQSFQLQASGQSAGDTSITLQSFKYSDGTTNIVTADLGDWCYMTLEPNSGTQEEAIQFTGVTQNASGTATLTGVSSVGFNYPYTVTSGLAKSHAGGVTCIISNDAAMYGNIIQYMNSTLASGISPVATQSSKGIVQIATTAQINAGTATGSSGAYIGITPDQLLLSNYALASGTTLALAGTSGTPSSTNKFVTQASLKYGGTGADGALAVTSGNTNIDCANAATVVKNYSSISITGTGTITFINPNTNGTTIILKSQGAVTLTSSAAPMVIASGMGAAGGNDGYGFAIVKTNKGVTATNNTGGAGGALPTLNPANAVINLANGKYMVTAPGAGGGSGLSTGSGDAGGGGGGSIVNAGTNGSNSASTASNTAGTGSAGGGVLIIECGGALNFTTASGISVAGLTGGAGSGAAAGGGGGGGGGVCIISYTSLTANSGTITVSGGTGGAAGGSGGAGGAGGNGYSFVAANVELV